MKVLVCGGRDYADSARVESELESLYQEGILSLVIHGGARGADSLAGEIARARYGVHEVIVKANWYLHEKAAGPMRNKAMLELGPDMVLAFPGGRGTADMVRRASAAGIKVREVM